MIVAPTASATASESAVLPVAVAPPMTSSGGSAGSVEAAAREGVRPGALDRYADKPADVVG